MPLQGGGDRHVRVDEDLEFQIRRRAIDGALGDDHAVNVNIFEAMKFRSQKYDQAVSALVEDIHARGLDQDVLVVVTTDLRPDSMLDRAGNFHSNKLKVTERFRLIDSTHIQYEATLDDPLTYTRPWTIEMPLYRLIDENAQTFEHKCVPFADMLLYHDLIGDKTKP